MRHWQWWDSGFAKCKGGGRGWGQTPKISFHGSVLGRIWAAGRCVGFCGITGPPRQGNWMSRWPGMSRYGGRVIFYLPGDLHMHLLPSLSILLHQHLFPLQEPVNWPGTGCQALRSVVVEQRGCIQNIFAFSGVSNSNQYIFWSHFDAVFSPDVPKSCKYLFTLTTCIKTFIHFYFGKLESLSHAVPLFHFRVADFPFISKIHVGCETQLMDTTKYSPTVSKIDSHNIRGWS